MKAGVLLNPNGLWIGAHYSPYNKRWCINLIPCVTIWVAFKGGNTPDKQRNRLIKLALRDVLRKYHKNQNHDSYFKPK